jgi:NDP-sugar pyrophosphorylase family protein
MDVRALVFVGGAGDLPPHAAQRQRGLGTPESIAGIPLGLLDVLGRPVLDRVVEQLRSADISNVRVIAASPAQPWPGAPRPDGYSMEWMEGQTNLLDGLDGDHNLWRAAERTFSQFAFSGADLVVVVRIGAYAELDYDELIQFHLDHSGKVTAVRDASGELLEIFVINASRRNDAACLFRSRLTTFRGPCLHFPFGGYVNRLASAADFRQLAVDAFFGKAKLQPHGDEIRPGVWAAPSARIHPKSRVLAPAFVGEYAKVRAAAVLTRCAVLERGAEVRTGTIVEDATLLPYTWVGEKLDVVHSVVGFRRVMHLTRKVEVLVDDPTLVDIAEAAPLRTFKSIAALASYLPVQLLRGVFQRDRKAVELPGSVDAQSPSLKSSPGLPPSSAEAVVPVSPVVDAVVGRRYGNE